MDGGIPEGTEREALARLVEALPLGILLLDGRGERVLLANATWTDLLGFRPEPGLTRAALAAAFRFERADGTPFPPDEGSVATALRTGRRAEVDEVVFVRPDGNRIPVMVTAIPLGLSQAPGFDAVLVVARDRRDIVRARAESQEWEERFESVVATNRQIVYDYDRVRQRMRVSGSVQVVLGFDRDACNRDPHLFGRLIHPEDRALTDAALDLARAGLRSEFDLEYRMRHADGHWLLVHDRGRVTYGPDGRAVRILGTMVDVTATREMERQLEHTQRLETVGTLAGGIAHDFNNQLTAVIGHLDLLAEHLVGHADAASHVPPARLAAQRCADLTRSLLAFSRKTSPLVSVVCPGTLVREALLFAGSSLPPSIRIVSALDPEPWPVEADAGQIEQVLLNLIVNARDAMDGAGELRVALRNVEVDAERARSHPGARRGAFVEMEVADSGGGIAPEVLPRIFEPFFTTKGVGRGTGLGLSMAHGIVQSHRGWIEVESATGAGARFRVLLPRAATTPATGVEAARHVAPAGSESLLVVDDEVLVRDTIGIALSRAGHAISTAADGAMALEYFGERGERFDLAIVDLTLPDMSGVKVMDALHARRPGFPVVLMSGFTTAAVPEDALARAVGFLGKPFGVAELKATVRRALDTRSPRGTGPAGPPAD